jgi:thymidylate synthase (FAD)
MEGVTMQITPVAWTAFQHPEVFDDEWRPTPGASGGEGLVEAAGRECYQSWHRPNPATATTDGYIRHILEVGHFSVLEHASVTFLMRGLSRSCTHELVRSRHLSFSQLSQRFAPPGADDLVTPPLFDGDPQARSILADAQDAAARAYDLLQARAEEIIEERNPTGVVTTGARKQAREAARAVLPNAQPTSIVVTGNLRAWRHFISIRASEHADAEIRALALRVLSHLWSLHPAVFADFEVRTLPDGRMVASTRFQDEG